jgi:hypothetical protein
MQLGWVLRSREKYRPDQGRPRERRNSSRRSTPR